MYPYLPIFSWVTEYASRLVSLAELIVISSFSAQPSSDADDDDVDGIDDEADTEHEESELEYGIFDLDALSFSLVNFFLTDGKEFDCCDNFKDNGNVGTVSDGFSVSWILTEEFILS